MGRNAGKSQGMAESKTKKTKQGVQPATDAAAPLTWTLKRKPTINDVARLAEVSKKTVSRVINQSPFVKDDTREKIDAIIRQIGYAPDPQARGLASQRSFLLGLIYDNPNAQYIVNIQSGVLEASRKAGYELVVHPCDRSSPRFAADVKRFVERQKLDGVVLLPPVSENNALAETLAEAGCRVVRIVAAPLDQPANTVVYHDWKAAGEVADHLVDLGHRAIGFITGPSFYRSAHERARGFINRLAAHGITLPPEQVVEGAYTFESGDAAAEILLGRPDRPTAIFASNDEMAAGVYKAAYRRGLVIPRDLTVIGFDDSALASRMCPTLSTVRSPIRDMGRMAAEKLIARIAAGDAAPIGASEVVPHLLVRESSAAPAS